MNTPLYRAAINCPHTIDANRVILHFDAKQPGHNALDQLARRLDSVALDKNAELLRSLGRNYYAPDGTLVNADGTRSVFDDVDA